MASKMREVKRDNIIYGLVDPSSLSIRYIGLSTYGLTRPRVHGMPSGLRDGNLHRARWIKKLQRAGKRYGIVILERVADASLLPELERWWIAYGRACGWELTNHTDGGEGILNVSQETRDKIAAKARGRKVSEATRQKMREAKARQGPRTWGGKIAASLKGRPKSEEHRRKLSLAKTGKPGHKPTEAHIEAIREGQRRRWARVKGENNG